MSNKITWNEANTARLLELAGSDKSVTVSLDTVADIAADLGGSVRSVSAKLRKMEYTVAKVPAKTSSWTADEESALIELVQANPNAMTYGEIAAVFLDGKFTSKQIQGKLLNLELFGLVRATEKKIAPRTYTPEQEAKFIAMVAEGACIEDLVEAFDKPAASIRGKALSLLRAEQISAMPSQRESAAKQSTDALEGLDVANMTVAALVEATGKTERGIKSILSRRGLKASDYDGASRREKLDNKAE